MPASIAIRPPDRYSFGAINLRNFLGNVARVVRRSPIPRQYTHVINWGNSAPITTRGTIFNQPEKISDATNKQRAFWTMGAAQVTIPEWQTTPPTVREGEIWLARTVLNGSGGEGIVVLRAGDTVPRAPLYVRYVRKLREFRVHVVRGEAIFVQEKLRRNGAEQTRDQQLLRNYNNGWVFAVSTVSLESPEIQPLIAEAIKAVVALGLDFGAVDCLLERSTNKPYVLEVNTAPGLDSPSLLTAYSQSFKQACGLNTN